VICLPVVADRTSGIADGAAASGQNANSRAVAVRSRSWSLARSGGHAPPGNCAQTRMRQARAPHMVLVFWHEDGDEHVDVEQTDHGRTYSPSASRLTSATVSVGASGRGGNTGTPPSTRTSASAKRLSNDSTKTSTG